VGHCAQALIESIFICGGGSAVPGVGPRLLQDISAHLLPSMQPVLCPLPEYLPEHAGSTDLPQLHACSRIPNELRRLIHASRPTRLKSKLITEDLLGGWHKPPEHVL